MCIMYVYVLKGLSRIFNKIIIKSSAKYNYNLDMWFRSKCFIILKY